MTETVVMPNSFAPMRHLSTSYESLIRDRFPCAISKIFIQGEEHHIGKIEFFSTPAGTVMRAGISSIPHSGEKYEPLFLEICDKDTESCEERMYKIRSKKLPPIFVKNGKGDVTFLTSRLSAADLIGRRLLLKKNGEKIASGNIAQAKYIQ